MKILITGGFGFVGSHLVDTLLKTTTHQIHVVDNLSSNPLPLERLLTEIGPHSGRLTYDICTVADYCLRFHDKPVDQIYHLASIVGPAGVISHMGRIAQAIVSDTASIMDLAARHHARLVDVSTSEVYGGGVQGLCHEETPKVISPFASARLEYAVGKLAAETALLNMCQVTDLQACIIRPFNISGPRQSGKGGFVLPRFVWRALKGMPLPVFGSGTQLRAFTHVLDIVSGLILLMEKSAFGRVYNLGNPANKGTIKDLAEAVIRVAGSTSTIAYVDPKSIYGPHYEDANDKFPVSDRAFELGWKPLRSRDEIIADTVAYFSSLPEELGQMLGA
jgi:UDP-glucose 4-epimerase